MRISKKLSLFILGAIVLLLIASRWSGKTDSQSAAASNSMQQGAAKSVLSVQLEAAQQSSMQPRLLANGTVAAWQEAIISAEVQGLVIDKIPVTIGQTVKKGAVLTRFRQQSIANDLAQARAHVAEAKAAWTEADANAERVRHVENSGALSKQQEDQFMNAAILTKAKLDAAEAALRSQQHRFRQTTLRAPDRGIISKNSATIGQVVSAGQELFRLIRQQRIEWRGEFNSADISKVKPGMEVQLTLPDFSTTTGKVRMISPTAEQTTRNIVVYVDMPNNIAKPGMFAKGEILLEKRQVWSVPEAALVVRDGFHYLMTVNDQQIVHALKVQPGNRQGGRIELKNYQATDVQFVSKGASFLYDGDRVQVDRSGKR